MNDQQHREDSQWMRAALAEAQRGEGGTRPNPPVGCVIVKDGRILGRGYHAVAGGPHAEVRALESAAVAGHSVAGATLYVTLEPCSTYGRTPPCTEAILRSGVRRVVVATQDANPRHAGRGLDVLRAAGIDVETGVEAVAAVEILRPFFKRIQTGRPWLTLKMAQSLDGGIADHAGQSKWITSPVARQYVRTLRRRADVVLVGAGTVLADDPTLLRSSEPEDGGALGMRAVVDGRGVIPLRAKIFTDGHANQTYLLTTEASEPSYRAAVAATGAHVLVLPREPIAESPHAVSIPALLEALGAEGFLHIFCEGGAALASSLINGDWVDELDLFVAPLLLGRGAKATFGAYPYDLPTAPRFRWQTAEPIGDDWLFRLRRRED